MNNLVTNAEELVQYFAVPTNATPFFLKTIREGVYVTGKVRKDFMVSVYQGRICVQGHHYHISFENQGGGVYLAKLEGF